MYEDLDKAINDLKTSLLELQQSMREVRQAICNEAEESNYTFANNILIGSGYSPEAPNRLNSWGIDNNITREMVVKLIYEVIDYRKDASLHHCK